MIRLLSQIARVMIVISAFFWIIVFILGGFYFARYQEYDIYGATFKIIGGVITPREISYSVIGGILGLISAGAYLGIVATLFVICDHLQVIVALLENPTTRDYARREPHIY